MPPRVRPGCGGTIVDLVVNYPGMLLAVAGTAALVMVVVTSIRKARARLRYESWHLIHLYGYLGAGLALPHQLWTGADFLSSPGRHGLLVGLYARVPRGRGRLPGGPAPLAVPACATACGVGGGRGTRREHGDRGWAGVEGLDVRGGQFFNWRFLDGPGWTRANPYSLSAALDGRTLRFTAAHVGDGSARLAGLRPRTRVPWRVPTAGCMPVSGHVPRCSCSRPGSG